MLAQYRRDPSSVDQSWRDHFAATLPAPEPLATPPEGSGDTDVSVPAPVGSDSPGEDATSAGADSAVADSPVADSGVPPQLRHSAPPAPPAPTSPASPSSPLTPTRSTPSRSSDPDLATATVTAEKAFAQKQAVQEMPRNTVSVTRSDLPPAPPSQMSEATSPYTRLQHARAAAALNADAPTEDTTEVLKGIARATAKNMEASLGVPTATSARQIPAKLLIENRVLLNAHLARTVGGKVSFTHLIGYAVVEALCEMPAMNVRYSPQDSKPAVEHMAHVGFGLAIDVARPDGTRNLL
ncbi:MAG: 2-oxo acid dehydrogenase subunit E2, partial [Pauljensenia sp.]